MIFEGFTSKYAAFVLFVNSRQDTHTIEDPETLLLDQENHVEKQEYYPNTVICNTRCRKSDGQNLVYWEILNSRGEW